MAMANMDISFGLLHSSIKEASRKLSHKYPAAQPPAPGCIGHFANNALHQRALTTFNGL